jgi:hypothetical protein
MRRTHHFEGGGVRMLDNQGPQIQYVRTLYIRVRRNPFFTALRSANPKFRCVKDRKSFFFAVLRFANPKRSPYQGPQIRCVRSLKHRGPQKSSVVCGRSTIKGQISFFNVCPYIVCLSARALYSGTMPRALQWSQAGAVPYERG